MSFWITIIRRPRAKSDRQAAAAEGFIDIPELDVMVGEHGVIAGLAVLTVAILDPVIGKQPLDVRSVEVGSK